jgi:hypothetical protein
MGGGMANLNQLDGNVDLNPDFVFESRGRLVEGGYEVEIRIPFKTLRYQDASMQDWGLHVLRKVQHSGVQDSWTPALRANASFLTQEGTLEGIHDIKRGLVLEATPTATAHANGAPGAAGAGGWRYDSGQEFGGDVRWGMRQNLTLNGTVNPDFSQVEADVGQVTLNERFALFYPEKRPFFLEGLAMFDTPSQLIYTRRITAPSGGVKITGKAANTNLAALFSTDQESASWDGGHRPLFGIARLRRDLGRNSTFGTVVTAREDGADYSRLAGGDVRIVHSTLYYLQLQAVESWIDSAGQSRRGSLLDAVWDRTGRGSGFHYDVKAIAPGFRAAAGFVNRTGIVDISAHNRLTFYGAPNALVQTWSAFGGFERFLNYDRPRAGSIEGSESVTPSATLRGGWRLNGGFFRNFVSYTPSSYASYSVERAGQTAAFTVPDPEKGLYSGSLSVTTPTFRRFTATATYATGEAALFREAAPGRSSRIDATVDLRPSGGLRTSVQFTRLALDRDRDGSRFSRETIPRVKFEYQINPAMFVRLVGQYAARTREPLVDRNGDPIFVSGVRDAGDRSNELQMDWLFSYRPVPGTLFYFGYGSTMTEADEFRFANLTRSRDGFFAKISYLFRM